jgi:hypothetical protein
MAYGKIKSDTLVYDNSGSDVEITVSGIPTAADLAAKATTSAEQTFTAGQRGEITELAAGTSFTIDLDASNNFLIQPNGTYTVTLSNISGAKGQCGSIFIKPTAAAASGSFPTTMKFVGGAAGITLTGTSGSIDRIDYIVQDDSSGYECLTCNFTANYVA